MDAQVRSEARPGALSEVEWSRLIESQHLGVFIETAKGIVQIASQAKVLFLVDARIIELLRLWADLGRRSTE